MPYSRGASHKSDLISRFTAREQPEGHLYVSKPLLLPTPTAGCDQPELTAAPYQMRPSALRTSAVASSIEIQVFAFNSAS